MDRVAVSGTPSGEAFSRRHVATTRPGRFNGARSVEDGRRGLTVAPTSVVAAEGGAPVAT